MSPNSDFDNFIDNNGSGSNLRSYGEKSTSLDANSEVFKRTELESKSKLLDGNVFWDKLENWVEQYKKDSEFWGIGTGPIFSIFQDSDSKVEKVVINEDEILRRSGVEPLLYKDGDVEDLNEVNEKISHAKVLAREMENGNDEFLRNSSVVKFFTSEGKSSLVSTIQGVSLKPVLGSKFCTVGITVACCVYVIMVASRLFKFGGSKPEYTRFEKEMMRRKVKARMKKDEKRKGTVEVIQDFPGQITASVERPQLDKQELMNSIRKVGESSRTLVLPKDDGVYNALSVDIDDKIHEIRSMARQARELEKRDSSNDNNYGEEHQTLNELSNEEEMIQKRRFVNLQSEMDHAQRCEGQTRDGSGITEDNSAIDDSKDESVSLTDVASTNNSRAQTSELINMKFPDESERHATVMDDIELDVNSFGAIKIEEQSEASKSHSRKPSESSAPKKFRIIQSVEEAQEYLSKKRDIKSNVEHEVRSTEQVDPTFTKLDQEERDVYTNQSLDGSEAVSDPSILTNRPDSMYVSEKSSSRRTEYFANMNMHSETVGGGEKKDDVGAFTLSETESSFAKLPNETEMDFVMSEEHHDDSKIFSPSFSVEPSHSSNTRGASVLEKNQKIPAKENMNKDVAERKGEVDVQLPRIATGQENRSSNQKQASSVTKVNWLEKNFHEIEPIFKKIGVGFRDNYMVTKEKTNDGMKLRADMSQLLPDEDDSELEWMEDERLREIVFKVRDNEISGRDPFHLMDDEEKLAFFSGLEKKVEQENAKLLNLHEWVHSNIENLNYGADGISLYDPPEKIIPRWKGPPAEKIHEFLTNSMAEQKEIVPENVRYPNVIKKSEEGFHQLSKEFLSSDDLLKDSALCNQNKSSTPSRTVIEGSDGSIKAGKKSGKEYWEHTKKWSQGFLESYNAETDPEVKAVMKDMGKDLERWITEKEIKEAADLIDKLPQRGQELIKEKLNKVKREMEVFGPQAFVSKYREYADEKEEDYLWWLDLPYVLCIELYTEQQGEQKVGLYSLEMAADLELDPKQYHVIAFEDAGDCKNMCYIIQAHMEMLGNGNAFVVARPPKDAFRECKANGFGVTVIRKGELQLNVDQTLEEVEELIAEFGSKIYHDTIMRERSVDISAVMKGVFGLKKHVRR